MLLIAFVPSCVFAILPSGHQHLQCQDVPSSSESPPPLPLAAVPGLELVDDSAWGQGQCDS